MEVEHLPTNSNAIPFCGLKRGSVFYFEGTGRTHLMIKGARGGLEHLPSGLTHLTGAKAGAHANEVNPAAMCVLANYKLVEVPKA